MESDDIVETSLDEDQEVEAIENEEELESYDENPDEEEDQEVEEEDDSEEIDFNGKSHKLPKEIAEAVKLMQKDYTVKTQSVAEQRKAFERDVNFQNEVMNERAQVIALDNQLKQYSELDWNRLIDEDPVMAQKLQLQQSQMIAAKGKLELELGNKIAAKRNEVTLQEQQEIAKRMQESETVLKRDIKGWNPEIESKLQDFAVKDLGFDRDDVIKSKTDPRLYKLLHMAHIGQQVISKQQSKPVAVPKKAEPVPTVKGRGAKVSHMPDPNKDWDGYQKWRKQGH